MCFLLTLLLLGYVCLTSQDPIPASVHLSVSVSLSLCPYVFMSLCLSVFLSLCLFVFLSLCLSVSLYLSPFFCVCPLDNLRSCLAFSSWLDLKFGSFFDDECDMAFLHYITTVMDFFSFLSCLFYRSLTSNLPNVNLPNVNLQIPKVPNLPVPVAGLSVNLPQMPSFSTPSWMAAIYDSECVFHKFTVELPVEKTKSRDLGMKTLPRRKSIRIPIK